jgi:putative ABC transport system permease protein
MKHRWISWFHNSSRRTEVDDDLDAEINAHVQLLTDEKMAGGVAPELARREALLETGGVEQVKAKVREVRTGLWLEQLLQDLRYGLRMLAKSPGFASLAVLTLALGIGANTAMFSVVHAVLLQPIPFTDPSRVVAVWQRQANGEDNVFSTPNFLEWKRQPGATAAMAAFIPEGRTLGTRDGVERITGWRASWEMFPLLGVVPSLGRAFSAEEDRPGGANIVLLSNAFWKTRFQSDAKILGSKIDLDSEPFTVIGVMPPGFHISSTNTEQFWRPLQLQTQDTAAASRSVHWIFALTRLEPGSSIRTAQAQIAAVAARLRRDDATGDAGYGITLQNYRDSLTEDFREPLLLLMGCVGFVLLIACCNVANLLLARGTVRRAEISIRAALGARRSRLLRQLLTESVLLSLLGGGFGLLFAFGALRTLIALHPARVPHVETIGINGAILAFTMVVCLGVGILFGIVPALTSSRMEASQALHDISRGSTRAGGAKRVALVMIETAMAAVLLIGAGLSLESLWKVSRVDPGFNPSGLLTFSIAAPAGAASEPYVFYSRVAERVRAVPGVQAAALARNVPLSGTDPSMPIDVDGHEVPPVEGASVTRLRIIGPGYFQVFQTPLLRGREFTNADSATAQPVVIISQSLAQRFWPNHDALGKALKPKLADAPWYTVVGISADVRHVGLDAPVTPTAYYPYTQLPHSVLKLAERFLTITVRSNHVEGLPESIRRAVADVNKTVPVYDLKTVNQMLADAGALRRFDMWLFSAFAGLALALSTIGVYGVMAYSVAQRTREIGIRMALGATRGRVLRMILLQGMKMGVAGVALGAAGALGLTRLMVSLLYEVSPTDARTFVAVSGTLVAFVLVACYLPSLRATRVDPNVALRCE